MWLEKRLGSCFSCPLTSSSSSFLPWLLLLLSLVYLWRRDLVFLHTQEIYNRAKEDNNIFYTTTGLSLPPTIHPVTGRSQAPCLVSNRCRRLSLSLSCLIGTRWRSAFAASPTQNENCCQDIIKSHALIMSRNENGHKDSLYKERIHSIEWTICTLELTCCGTRMAVQMNQLHHWSQWRGAEL